MQQNRSHFFKIAYRLLRYFAIASVSFVFTIMLSQIMGGQEIAGVLMSQIGPVLLRSSGVVIFVMAAAVIFESSR